MNDKKIFIELLAEMERAYDGSAHKTSMEYTYGFMDALAVVRRQIEKPAEPDPWKMAWGILLCTMLAGMGAGKPECHGCPRKSRHNEAGETEEKKDAMSDYCCCPD